MHRRWIQNLCIIIIFILCFVAVIATGMMQGKKNRSLEETGISLTEKEPLPEDIKTPSPLPSDDTIVYTTESGTKYHIFSDCASLKNSKNIMGSTCKTAQDEGKGLCALCEARNKN